MFDFFLHYLLKRRLLKISKNEEVRLGLFDGSHPARDDCCRGCYLQRLTSRVTTKQCEPVRGAQFRELQVPRVANILKSPPPLCRVLPSYTKDRSPKSLSLHHPDVAIFYGDEFGQASQRTCYHHEKRLLRHLSIAQTKRLQQKRKYLAVDRRSPSPHVFVALLAPSGVTPPPSSRSKPRKSTTSDRQLIDIVGGHEQAYGSYCGKKQVGREKQRGTRPHQALSF